MSGVFGVDDDCTVHIIHHSAAYSHIKVNVNFLHLNGKRLMGYCIHPAGQSALTPNIMKTIARFKIGTIGESSNLTRGQVFRSFPSVSHFAVKSPSCSNFSTICGGVSCSDS